MEQRHDAGNLAQRLAEMAARFDERIRRELRPGPRKPGSGFLGSAYSDLHDLFTRDITSGSLRDLLKYETRDTVRFFTREIDFLELRRLPWYRRYPLIAWRIFQGMAYRLSPPRRIAFAGAVFAFFVGWLRMIFTPLRSEGVVFGILPPGAVWWLAATMIFAFLLLMELKDKLGLKGDLEIAREIQFGLVPSQPLQRSGFQIHHAMRPANTVGGDYYDIIELESEKLAVVVGDVAGKGMPAALLMALLQGSLRTLITAGLRGSELVSRLNDYLCASIPANRLVTLFYGELDLCTGRLQYVNAGHNPPLLIRADGSIERLASTAVVLGFIKGCSQEMGAVQLPAGSRLMLYTDGIVEAFDPAEQEYGDRRLELYLSAGRSIAPSAFIEGLIGDVLAFCGDHKPHDDMTLLTVDRS